MADIADASGYCRHCPATTGSIEAHGKRLQTSLIETVPIFKRRIQKPQLRKSLCEGRKRYLRFQSRKRSTQAIVDALSKGQMMVAIGASDVQTVRIGELR